MPHENINTRFIENQAYGWFRSGLKNLSLMDGGPLETPDRIPLTVQGISNAITEVNGGLDFASALLESAADYYFRYPTLADAGPWIFEHFRNFASDMDNRVMAWVHTQRPFIRDILVLEDVELRKRIQTHDGEPDDSIARVTGPCLDRIRWMEGYIYWLNLIKHQLHVKFQGEGK